MWVWILLYFTKEVVQTKRIEIGFIWTATFIDIHTAENVIRHSGYWS